MSVPAAVAVAAAPAAVVWAVPAGATDELAVASKIQRSCRQRPATGHVLDQIIRSVLLPTLTTRRAVSQRRQKEGLRSDVM